MERWWCCRDGNDLNWTKAKTTRDLELKLSASMTMLSVIY